MTAIAAIRTETNVVMSADSALSGYNNISILQTWKIFKNGPYLIGASGSPRLGQALMFNSKIKSLIPPEDCSNAYAFEFVITKLIPLIRRACGNAGFLTVTDNKEELDGLFLLAFTNHLFTVDRDLQVTQPHKEYAAIGSGAHYALGCMYMNGSTFDAVHAAIEFCPTVSEPIRTLET